MSALGFHLTVRCYRSPTQKCLTPLQGATVFFLSVYSSIGSLEKQHLAALLLRSTYHTSEVEPVIPCALIETSFSRKSGTRVKAETSDPSLDIQ